LRPSLATGLPFRDGVTAILAVVELALLPLGGDMLDGLKGALVHAPLDVTVLTSLFEGG
jgi:hypothetical protein